MDELLSKEYFNNSIERYLIVAGIVLLGILAVNLFRKVVIKRLKVWAKKTVNKVDDYLVESFDRFVIPVLKIGAFYVGTLYLTITPLAKEILKDAFMVVATFYSIRLITKLLKILLESSVEKKRGGEARVRQLKGVLVVVDVTVWSLGIVFLFDNLGYDVTTIITGLGIGGLAIALAAQTILGDLFNYFVIFFDRPFEIGDFVVVDDKKGDIEYIGIKTTRIKSISGEQIIISNSDLTTSRIHNFKRMKKRRVSFSLGVTYQTSPQQLREIPTIIDSVITSQKDAEMERCHFYSYGDFSLNFEIIYYVTNPTYGRYMDVQQAINLSIFDVFTEKGIEFAYPTQTVFVEKN